jgi:uncharacterized protein YndB with AHSA1/START domain
MTAPSLTLKRRFNASPAKVFAAWTDPALLMRWMGPKEIENVNADCDPRIGGAYRFVMRAVDGETHEFSGVYREVVKDEKLVFTWAWRSTPERQSLVTILIKPDGDGALLTLIHEQFADEAARDRHAHGWGGSLDRLEQLFA